MESLFGDSDGSPEDRGPRKALFDGPEQENSLFGPDIDDEGRGSPWLDADDNAPNAPEERQPKSPLQSQQHHFADEIRPQSKEPNEISAQRPITPQKPMPSFEQPTPHSEVWGSPKGLDRPSSAAAYSNIAASRPQHERNGSSQIAQPQFGARYGPGRTTSIITTRSEQGSTHSRKDSYIAPPPTLLGNQWRSNGDAAVSAEDLLDGSSSMEAGFGNQTMHAQRQPERSSQSTSFAGSNIRVILLPEKEGPFLFQHHNYQVTGLGGNPVVRRYSDFLWLLECLHRRYPFRRLPILPPKRVGGTFSKLGASDSSFLEKRRRGLQRFSNALIRHPVLSREQLVVQFLTVPTELAVWAKQATLTLTDEFEGRVLQPDHEVPPSEDLFDTTRSGLKKSAEIYINLCITVDRLVKRTEGIAADHAKLAQTLNSLTGATHATYSIDDTVCPKARTFEVHNNEAQKPPINVSLSNTARHCDLYQGILKDEAGAWDEGVLEDLKAHRDALVSMRDMFERRDQYEKDTINKIPNWEKRIKKNEDKLAALQQKPEEMVKPGEKDKLVQAIDNDKKSIVAQHAKTVFVTECIREELTSFQHSSKQVINWNYKWAEERVKYSNLQHKNWEVLESQQRGTWEEYGE